MAHILVIFGTTHGQTAKIASALGDRLRVLGHDADIADAAIGAGPDPRGYDGVIVVASLHIGKYQRAVVTWVSRHSSELNRRPTAFVSVCLGVLQKDPKVQRDLRNIVDAFTRKAGWQPLDVQIVAGALKYTQYNFLVRWVMKRISRKEGGDTDTSRDYEYTDWAALRQFADQFAAERLTSVGGVTAAQPLRSQIPA